MSFLAVIRRASLHAWERVRHESVFALLLPGRRPLLTRYEKFRRFQLLLLLYNTALVYLVLLVNNTAIESLFPDLEPRTVQYLIIYYFEGLFRYVIWTMANYRVISHLRRSFDAGLYLTTFNPGLQMGLFFAQAFFFASLIGSTIYHFHASSLNFWLIWSWLSGERAMSLQYVINYCQFFLHSSFLAIFRATAIAYALFGGRRVAGSFLRAFLGYALGAFFLFTLHYWGMHHAEEAILALRRIPARTHGAMRLFPLTQMGIRLLYLIPYYFICIIGAEIFIAQLRLQRRPSARGEFEIV